MIKHWRGVLNVVGDHDLVIYWRMHRGHLTPTPSSAVSLLSPYSFSVGVGSQAREIMKLLQRCLKLTSGKLHTERCTAAAAVIWDSVAICVPKQYDNVFLTRPSITNDQMIERIPTTPITSRLRPTSGSHSLRGKNANKQWHIGRYSKAHMWLLLFLISNLCHVLPPFQRY